MGIATPTYGLVLSEGHDLLAELERSARLRSGVCLILTAVGSLTRVVVRPAVPDDGVAEPLLVGGPLELISLTGTVSTTRGATSHVHISVADHDGNVTAGHLRRGSEVRLGARIALTVIEGAADFWETPRSFTQPLPDGS